MKYLAKILAFVLLLSNITLLEGASSCLPWFTNYEAALKQAQETHKPLVLFFTGSDWCTWCHQLERESLETKEFAQAAAEAFIFVKLDFPGRQKLSPALSAQNQRLQKKYKVNSFPTIVVLDPNENILGVTGYVKGNGTRYAGHLAKLAASYHDYRNKVQQLEMQTPPPEELKKLYNKAQELQQPDMAQKIVEAGLKTDPDHFFLLEKYRLLAEAGKLDAPETQQVRQALLNSDPQNQQFIPYSVAVIEYEALGGKALQKQGSDPNATLDSDAIVAPLNRYLEAFGSQDKENGWKVQMTIAVTHMAGKRYAEALKYAEAAQQTAPADRRGEIDPLIAEMKAKAEK